MRKGRVNQHSVGMQYVKGVLTAIDNKDYKEEYENWKKYVDLVANKSDIRNKYFFPVLEGQSNRGFGCHPWVKPCNANNVSFRAEKLSLG